MLSKKRSTVRIAPLAPTTSFAGPTSVTSPVRTSREELTTLSEPRWLAVCDLDARLAAARSGVIVGQAPESSPDRSLHAAILEQVAVTLRASGSSPIVGLPRRPGARPVFRDIGTVLGIEPTSTDPFVYGRMLAGAAGSRPILAPLPAEGSWDHAVLSELVRGTPRLFFLVTTTGQWSSAGTSVVKLEAIATTWEQPQRADRAKLDAEMATLAPGRERDLLTQLAVARCPVSRSALDATEAGPSARPRTTVDALIARGLVTTGDGEHVALARNVDPSTLAPHVTPHLLSATARALMTGSSPCPWAYARAAELLVQAGELDAADAAMTRASRQTDDERAADDIRARWDATLAAVPVKDAEFSLRVRAAERALGNGEAHDAKRWIESLATIRPDSAEADLLTGRSLILLGDVVLARETLDRALARATDDDTRSKAVAGLAEISYVVGDLDRATVSAHRSIDLARSVATRLEGRNILGKVHLAAARWEEADAHFAEDAAVATQLRDDDATRQAELRARLNRAIALMSRGCLDEARAMLERVLEDGVAHGEDRARAFALRNLAVVAYRQHDYGRALSLWDAAVRFPSALCGRITTAFTLANLADLRLRLGLFEHADHTLAFGRRVLGGHAAPATVANLATVAARLALAVGNIGLARREVDSALSHAEAAGDRGDRIPDAYLVSARIALEEGERTRAGELLTTAEGLASNDRLRAEVAIVRVLERRATGRPSLDAAHHALEMARAADEEDLLAEVHALLAVVHRDAGRNDDAREHARRAIDNRDRVARGLPAEIRAAFLAKPEMAALSKLDDSLSFEPSNAPDAIARQAADRDVNGELDEAPRGNGASDPVEAIYPLIRRGSISLHDMKRKIEQGCIARAIAETNGNITRAAGLLGMKRPRLSQLVKQYGLLSHPDDTDGDPPASELAALDDTATAKGHL